MTTGHSPQATPARASRAPSSSATDYSRRRRGKGRRKAPFSLRRALDEDHAAARGLLAQHEERRVFRRAVPLQGLFQRRKFKHCQALRRPAAFERLHLAAAHGVSAAVLGDDRGNLLAVLLVGGPARPAPMKPTKATTRMSGPGVVSPTASPSIICGAVSQ